jgi:hypothetical protein
MLFQNGTPQVVGGTPGSFWQVQTNLQLVGQAWTVASLSLEARFGEAVRSLRERGHAVESIGDWAAGGAAHPGRGRHAHRGRRAAAGHH